MLKKVRCLIILIFVVLILASCDNKQKRRDEAAYSFASIEEFLTKGENTHLRAVAPSLLYVDEEDSIYNMLVKIEYEEQTNVSNLGERSPIRLYYPGDTYDLYFYQNESIVGVYYLLDGHISFGEAERYYKIDSDVFNEIYSRIELCSSNVESN